MSIFNQYAQAQNAAISGSNAPQLGTSLGQGLGTPKPPAVDTAVASLNQQLRSRLSHLHSIGCRFEALGDRLFGQLPAANSDSACPVQSGELGELAGAVPVFDLLLEQLERHAKRLEQL